MKRFVPFLFAALSLALGYPPASAQQLMRVPTCGDSQPPPGVSPGSQDTSGRACTDAGSGFGPATPTIPGTLTITTGGAAQDLAIANLARIGMVVQNPPTALEQGLGAVTGAVPSGLTTSASGATTLVVHGTAYTPGDTSTLTGGTHSQSAVLTTVATGVSTDFAPTVTAGGSGCTNNAAAVLTGTTGSTSPGSFFQLVGVISGNTLQSITSIYYPGYYTTNPTVLTAEPVTATGCTGTQVSIKMGPALATVQTAGRYSNPIPSNPVSEASSSGSGTGATWTVSFGGNPEDLYVNVGADATVNNGNFCNLAPGDTCSISLNGHPLTDRVSINAATTKHAVNATYGVQ